MSCKSHSECKVAYIHMYNCRCHLACFPAAHHRVPNRLGLHMFIFLTPHKVSQQYFSPIPYFWLLLTCYSLSQRKLKYIDALDGFGRRWRFLKLKSVFSEHLFSVPLFQGIQKSPCHLLLPAWATCRHSQF